MVRFILRFIGLLLLALGFIFVVYDGMKSIADRTIYATRLEQFWTDIHASSLQATRDAIDRYAASLWSIIMQPLIDQPAAAVFAIVGVVLIILGRKKRPLIGYARD